MTLAEADKLAKKLHDRPNSNEETFVIMAALILWLVQREQARARRK